MVPSRVIEPRKEAANGLAFVDLAQDREWNCIEKRKLHLSGELTAPERLCYAHEYGIADVGFLEIKRRRALMRYEMQELAERRCWRRDGTSVPIWDI